MSNVYLFAWGVFATLLAVGPLGVAFYLDSKNAKTQALGKAVPKDK